MGSQILQYLQKLLKTLALCLISYLFHEILTSFLDKRIKTYTYFFIRDPLALRLLLRSTPSLLHFRPASIKNVFCIQHPLSHSLALLDRLSPDLPLFHYLIQSLQLPLRYFVYWPPPFPSFSMLAARSSKASNASTPA